MTQTEYEQKRRECWEEFKQKSLTGDEVQWPLATRLFYIFCTAFDRAYALGKQEKDADTVISGWMARSEEGYIDLFQSKPSRDWYYQYGRRHGCWFDNLDHHIELPKNFFPDLTWNDDPIEVELIIKRKKK